MASLDSLPADQRAVLQLVLQQGRSYDDIAAMLSIDRAAVRQRALDAFDALGPSTPVPDLQRALLTDYLLGQLPPRVAEQVRDRLGESPQERAWSRVIASEVSSLARHPLPEIPAAAPRPVEPVEPAVPAMAAAGARGAGSPEARVARPPDAEPAPAGGGHGGREDEEWEPHDVGDYRAPARGGGLAPASSRRGGVILLALVIAAAVAVAIVLATSGGSNKPTTPKVSSSTGATGAGTPTSTTGTPTTGTSTTGTTSTTAAKTLYQVNLVSPTGGKPAGVAWVVKEGTTIGVVLKAQNMPANGKHDAYAVWLSKPGGPSRLVGYAGARVGSNGQLETAGPLKFDASSFSQMLVTLETHANPKGPGTVVLEGKFSEGSG